VSASGTQIGLTDIFAADGEMSRRCREMDWAATSLGPVGEWPAALRTAVRMVLECPVPINLWCGPELTLIYNDAYRAVLGLKHPQALGRPGAVVRSDIWAELSAMFAAVRRGGAPVYAEDARFIGERAGVPADFTSFTFSLSAVRDDAGDIVAFLDVASETTKRVRGDASDVAAAVVVRRDIERLLHESEQARLNALESEARYRFLANAIPVQVWTATPDGALDYVSDRAAAYFGKTSAGVIGEQWLTVLHADDVAPTTERWMHSVSTGEPYEVEFRLWSAEHAAYRWHLGRAVPQNDSRGAVIRWFGTNTDIEDWKRAEAELKRLTIEATEANRAKSDFLAAMSHELRTPLNAIGGYAQLIEMGVRGPITEAQRVDLLRIQRSKNHLDALVSDVLNFAKLGAGRIELRVREVDVTQTMDAVLEMVAPQLERKELHLARPATPRGLKVCADEDKARQILVNLMANALKFTPPNGTISLDVARGDTEVTVSVSDTGIGIPTEQIDRVFEPFVQAKRALDSSDQGVGLGLAISRQLARAMQGDLTVRSVAGQGSTFMLTLPRVDASS
jgi:PAS domain S-box-containing protein